MWATTRQLCRALRWVAWMTLTWLAGGSLRTLGDTPMHWVPKEPTIFSRSGQFIIHSRQMTIPTLHQPIGITNRTYIVIQPDALAVCAERVKARLLAQLAAPDRWRGRVHLFIRPGDRVAEPSTMKAILFADGWHYSLEIPERVEARPLVRSLLLVLLTEIANRHPGSHTPEIPYWLVDGLTGILFAEVGPDLVPQSNQLLAKFSTGLGEWGELRPNDRSGGYSDHAQELRTYLQRHPALTFNDLALPGPAELTGDQRETFRVCSQVLVKELLRLPQGNQLLWEMLARLTESFNWQTAFVRTFGRYFPRSADVEQWWAVTLQQFSGHDEANAWSRADSLKELDQILGVPVEVRNSEGAPPQNAIVPLQRVVKDMPFARQQQVLRTKISQLEMLQANASRDVVPLATGYLDALQDYLRERTDVGATTTEKGRPATSVPLAVRHLINRLGVLDTERAAAARAPAPPSANVRQTNAATPAPVANGDWTVGPGVR
jgi:hypothetical protein